MDNFLLISGCFLIFIMNIFSLYNLKDALESSREIISKALKDNPCYKIIVLVSGGDDSLTALQVARYLNVPIDYILHGKTGTGVKEVFDFVQALPTNSEELIIADAKDKYQERVLSKGFYGKGKTAHFFSYNDLKDKPFNFAISKHIKQGKRGRRVMLINGARQSESKRRKQTCKNPIRVDKHTSNVWVNIINYWSKEDCLEFLESQNIDRSPVSKCLGRSGECNCGTFANRNELIELKDHFKPTYDFLINLENQAIKNGFLWKWSEKSPTGNKFEKMEKLGQINIFTPMFTPMCVGCESKLNIDASRLAYSNNR